MSAVFARIGLAVIDVGVATFTRPTRLAYAFVVEQFVHANSVFAWVAAAQIDFFLASFTGKTFKKIVCINVGSYYTTL